MKKNTLTLALLVGCIALSVASISVSIAWFATSNRLQVSCLDITIDADRELYISNEIDGEYYESISKSGLIDANDYFIPLTTAHSKKWLDTKSDTPIFYDETKYSTYEYSEGYSSSDFGYFSEKFYLKSDDNVIVSIDPSKTFIKANEEKNVELADRLFKEYQEGDDASLKGLTKEEIKTRLDKLVNAMRYSLLITDEDDYQYVIIDPNKNEEVTYLGGLLDNNIDLYYDYYTKESDHLSYERLYGEYSGKENIIYDEPTNDDSDFEATNEEPSAFNAKHKAGIYRFNLEKSLANGVEIKKEEAIDLKDFEKVVKPFSFLVNRETPKEVVVSIYIEGWDLDSINYTMGATFVSSLSFTIERER